MLEAGSQMKEEKRREKRERRRKKKRKEKEVEKEVEGQSELVRKGLGTQRNCNQILEKKRNLHSGTPLLGC